MWLSYLFCWPNETPVDDSSIANLDSVALLIRQQNFLRAEHLLVYLLSAPLNHFDSSLALCLYCYLALLNHDFNKAQLLLDSLNDFPADLLLFRNYLFSQLWLRTSAISSFASISEDFWNLDSKWQPICASHANYAILVGDLDLASSCIDSITEPFILEVFRVRALIFQRQRKFKDAALILQECVERFPQHLELHAQYTDSLLEAKSQSLTIPALRNALQIHGEKPELMGAVCTVKLLQRHPSLARRSAFIQRLSPYIASKDMGRISNFLVTYELTGHSDWLEHLNDSVQQEIASNIAIQENLCLQLASIESKLLPAQLQSVASIYQSNPIAPPFCSSTFPNNRRRLRIGWVTGDVAQHPVARFIMGFFEAASNQLSHDHILVNLRDNGKESYLDKFQAYPYLGILDVSSHNVGGKVAAIRSSEFDVAIDLIGWTGGHFARGFLARLAPLQVNYLGYFASTGIPSIDYWLGDHALFPIPMREWHTELIHRLPRCFIAWQPSKQLDEAHVNVTDSPKGPIRFGCFNHNRKLSDSTLTLWGRLLDLVPGSNLVLKANASSDPHTQVLLSRRMQRCGLDANRVIWLPLAPTHREHLLQYTHVDVALDSFPNGGCTTTCEALWMGVPVITLTGNSYVSRMSTAVLRGAAMDSWCAASQDEYLQIAIQQADNLSTLRDNREKFRSQVVNNPLGDAASLMLYLEQTFSQLYVDITSRDATS